MKHVISRDGTRIAFEKTGEGRALIIVGGALGDHHFYEPLAKALAKTFTVYNFDRRGRGQSTDTLPYSVEREVEDVGALITEAGQRVMMYGHSAGSALALRTAAAGLDIEKLVLADPPFSPHSSEDEVVKERFVEKKSKVQAYHDKGDHRGAAAFFLSGFGLPSEAIEEMLNSPAGKEVLDCARALPYDFALLGDGLVPDAIAANVAIPTVVMTAETSPDTAEELVRHMPNARLQKMKESAHELPPTDIANVLTPFFTSR
jgi:pimeloyl-ACP methyl ester carboxylesterase